MYYIGGGGCNNDAFSVFGFLAFLLAAANLFMAEERRKKRDLNTEGKDINDSFWFWILNPLIF